ncbi:MAG TPA: alpha/beta fold hydrolase [Caulobacteraceae bacterium]|jgi:pimeloyl-ACP methyl ester carboxylesterase
MAKKHVTTPFGEVAYVERGEGPVALFVHGVFVNSHLWRHVIDRVCGVRRCIAIDLLSHGDSPVPTTQDISFRAQAQMLEAFCAALGLDQVDLVANDSGGAVAQIFAAAHPERLRTLTLTNCDVHDNYPPAAFAPTRAAADAGVFSAQRQAYYDDPTTENTENTDWHVCDWPARPARNVLAPLARSIVGAAAASVFSVFSVANLG